MWYEGGMQVNEDDKRLIFEHSGLVPLPTNEGLRMLDIAVEGDELQYLVFYGDINRWEEYMGRNLAEKGDEAHIDVTTDISLLHKRTESYLRQLMAEEIRISESRVDLETTFEDYGLNSIMIKNLNSKLDRKFGLLPKTLLFEYRTLEELANHLVERYTDKLVKGFGLDTSESFSIKAKPVVNVPSNSTADYQGDDMDIAIIGVSGRFPGSQNVEEFWENLKAGKDCISEIPSERWDWKKYYHPDPEQSAQGKIYCKWGGFLRDVDAFDALFFSISAREAVLMDPQERIFLETSWLALEDAGYTGKRKGYDSNVGVFVGVTTNDYPILVTDDSAIRQGVVPRAYPWSIANRVSYFFNFNGPSMPIDTACSSALVSVHLACESIRKGECRMALAGGINLYLHPLKYIGMCQMNMLSPDGRCHSFGDKANGFVPGEGVGAVILKPMRKALEDNDHIYAVIKATAVNHGGRTNGYTVPNPNAQAEVIEEALKKSGINPRTISFIEAHGTGTLLGDPIEIAGLTSAFNKYTSDKGFCAISSSKTNIGHLESAAGIAGLIKILLQMRYKELVPSLNSETLNPNLQLEDTPFYIQKKLSKWETAAISENGKLKEYPRRAGLSAFGAGGTNAHIILEEYEHKKENVAESEKNIFVLSAKNEERLVEYAKLILEAVKRINDSKPQESSVLNRDDVLRHIANIISRIIDVSEKDIMEDDSILDLLEDPLDMDRFAKEISSVFSNSLEVQKICQYGTLVELADYLCSSYKGNTSLSDGHMSYSNSGIASLLYTLQVGRAHMECRMAFIVSSAEELHKKLEQYCCGNREIEGFYSNNEVIADTLGSLFSGSAGEEFIKNLVHAKDFEGLAQLWVSGFNVDWGSLYTNKVPDLISLPGYPFEKKRLWYSALCSNSTGNSVQIPIPKIRVALKNTGIDITNSHVEESMLHNGKVKLKNVPAMKHKEEVETNSCHVLPAEKITDCRTVAAVNIPQNDPDENHETPVVNANSPLDGAKKDSAVLTDKENGNRPSFQQVYDEVRKHLAEVLFISPDEISDKKVFNEMGLDSVLSVEFVKKLNKAFELQLKVSSLFNYSTIKPLAEYCFQNSSFRRVQAPIAIEACAAPQADRSIQEKCSEDEAVCSMDNVLQVEGEEVKQGCTSETCEQTSNLVSEVKDESLPNCCSKAKDDVAIIGMAGNFPGASDVYEMWQNLLSGTDSIIETPRLRWDISKFYSEDINEPNKTNSKWGGFIKDVDAFDPLFFNISPAEAEMMDPQQRLFLETCWHAFEDSGYSPEMIAKYRCGVFAGVMNMNEYQNVLANAENIKNAQEMVGNSNAVLASRIAYFLNLRGPVLTIDTACSSSLVAVHYGCRSLQDGEADIMLAGGVNLYLTEKNYINMSKSGMLSPDGKCKTFDNSANGFVPAEGCGVVVMKLLSRAIEDGDYIYGVIKGSAVNQDGKSNGITAPNYAAQREVIIHAYQKAGINPETLAFIEAHGTGTKLGDPIEVDALTSAFKEYTQKKRFCAIGSIKANIGHTGAAAGVVGLIKALLAIKYRKLPPLIHFRQINEHINLEDSPFYINTDVINLGVDENIPIRAGISSFGFSGTNCHLVIQEYRSNEKRYRTGNGEEYHFIPLSARSSEELGQKVHQLSGRIEAEGNLMDIREVASTLMKGRAHFPARTALVVKDMAQLRVELADLTASLKLNADKNVPANNNDFESVCSKMTEMFNRQPNDKSNLLEIAELYCQGYEPHWMELNISKWRLPLPLYPFERERYWPKIITKQKSEVIHPLVHKNVSTFGKQCFTSTFEADTVYEKEHVVFGQKILPGTAYIEMALTAGEMSTGYKVFSLRNVRFENALPIPAEPYNLNIYLEQSLDSLVLWKVMKDGYQQENLLAEGEIELLKHPEAKFTLDTASITSRCTSVLKKQQCYDLFRTKGLEYGKSFQTIEKIYFNSQEALSYVALPKKLCLWE
ncbi:MAG TPA: beta-ketoacyl synthase N-terminal-like domain-containing protein [Ruminiclostridium sp.]|nr:beta-ketoacyl synthase N-terminal-like domain-containing protein [Ruminiclostridium sp.]